MRLPDVGSEPRLRRCAWFTVGKHGDGHTPKHRFLGVALGFLRILHPLDQNGAGMKLGLIKRRKDAAQPGSGVCSICSSFHLLGDTAPSALPAWGWGTSLARRQEQQDQQAPDPELRLSWGCHSRGRTRMPLRKGGPAPGALGALATGLHGKDIGVRVEGTEE